MIADLDGDGRSEVLVRPNTTDRSGRKLYCLEGDGRVRFVHQPTGSRRFGGDEYAEPWLAHRVFATSGPDGSRRLWAVFTHSLLFPSVLRELDPRDGTVRQEYWSNGYVEFVTEGTWAGRPVLFVGGTNNDFQAASLAVFAPDRLGGSTPAVRSPYACRDCAPGGPEALFLFPTLCTLGQSGRQATLIDAWVERGERVWVRVIQVAPSTQASSYYTLGPDGALVGAEISREFQAQHALLEPQGLLDHAFGTADERDVLPVRRWDGRRFGDLPRVPVEHFHASLADVYGVGLLFMGKSGIGKSECVLDLVERGHRLVADDVVQVSRRGNMLIGQGHELAAHHMEIRGVGLIDIPALFGIRAVRQQKRVEVVVHLEEWNNAFDADRSGLLQQETDILGVVLPKVIVPLNPGKNITVISEVVAMNHLLRMTGIDTAAAFNERLIRRMREKKGLREYLQEDFE